MANHPGAELRFESAGAVGTADETREAIDLLQYEIAFEVAHPRRSGPHEIIIVKKTTSISLRCHKYGPVVPSDPLWTFPLVIDMLRTFEGLLSVYGMREVKWEVWNQNIAKMKCWISLQDRPHGSNIVSK